DSLFNYDNFKQKFRALVLSYRGGGGEPQLKYPTEISRMKKSESQRQHDKFSSRAFVQEDVSAV
ncbi:hypothetical protein P5F40_15650, partial [Clostridium perfringens]|nr:hypothetical protein [Clostridium perfringens]